jgi:hypothetical protein
VEELWSLIEEKCDKKLAASEIGKQELAILEVHSFVGWTIKSELLKCTSKSKNGCI